MFNLNFHSDRCHEWKETILGESSEFDEESHPWKKHALSIVVAVVSAVTSTFFFNCSNIYEGMVYGVINYGILTCMVKIIELNYPPDERDNKKALLAYIVSAIMTTVITQIICGASLTYHAIFLLSASAYAGQIARLSHEY